MLKQKDYWCGICRKFFSSPAKDDHCPNCGENHDSETCPHCKYDGEMELVCPDCGIDGGNGGLSHACCCEREIEAWEEEVFDTLVDALQTIITFNRQAAHDQFGNAEIAEDWTCVQIARDALAKVPSDE